MRVGGDGPSAKRYGRTNWGNVNTVYPDSVVLNNSVYLSKHVKLHVLEVWILLYRNHTSINLTLKIIESNFLLFIILVDKRLWLA